MYYYLNLRDSDTIKLLINKAINNKIMESQIYNVS